MGSTPSSLNGGTPCPDLDAYPNGVPPHSSLDRGYPQGTTPHPDLDGVSPQSMQTDRQVHVKLLPKAVIIFQLSLKMVSAMLLFI